ncbi:MAG: hypothetical protein WBE97_14995, partial [Candidatus Acidiferrales bacterium]
MSLEQHKHPTKDSHPELSVVRRAEGPLFSATPAQIQPFLQFVRSNPPRINTSRNFAIPRISL